jgi:hypothetical protein
VGCGCGAAPGRVESSSAGTYRQSALVGAPSLPIGAGAAGAGGSSAWTHDGDGRAGAAHDEEGTGQGEEDLDR